MAGILVFTEVAEGKLARSGFELLGGARKLADDMGIPLTACLLGSNVLGLAQELIYYGADNVIVSEQPLLNNFQPDLYLAALEQICRTENSKLIMFSGSPAGMQMGPRLAYRLKAGIVTGCIAINISPGENDLIMHKPVYGGKATAVIVAREIQVITMRPKVMKPLEPDQSRKGSIKAIQIELTKSMTKTKTVSRVTEQVTGIKLEDANVVITGGRGIGGVEGFNQLEDLANLLNGAVGASRAAADSGWISSSRQVGLTGKIVAPDLYFAVGISGALQHVAGMSGSKHVIAINKDPEAPILRIAKLAIVEDYRKVLPFLTEKIKELI